MGILARTSHRRFSTGFYFDAPADDAQVHAADSDYLREADVVGNVLSFDEGSGIATVVQRNRFVRGERLALLQPVGPAVEFTVEELWDAQGTPIPVAPHPMMQVGVRIPGPVQPFAFLARISR